MSQRARTLLAALLGLSILVGLTGAAIGIYGLSIAGEANDKADTLLEARTTSRKITCLADNENADKINALNDRGQDLLRAVSSGGERPPEQQAAVDAFVDQQIAEYEALKIPLRDCSSQAAIDAYYETHKP